MEPGFNDISIHALLAESDTSLLILALCHKISIHALLAESDQKRFWEVYYFNAFLSTLSLRRATRYSGLFDSFDVISIHALLAESDLAGVNFAKFRSFDFYPRSPCGERRALVCSVGSGCLFLSTLSLRRATGRDRFGLGFRHYFYPRSPCGERRFFNLLCIKHAFISIHALLAESD